ncbi:hypothetical protein M408DRAFT_8357 [Serendipita vermifera MAFF 305830]|uniref:Uncharacterized protein n=1 Tax=Serendipita vermifera MAFF 305830 TaxID=933852 RepID=A0A0C2XJV8_SERVB|nr:hypothetical protein M408DRAFT_8357 [Serendipita vermifera MAFF 305830]
MKLSLFFILTTLVASLVALPVLNRGILESDTSSVIKGVPKVIQHKTNPLPPSHKAISSSQQHKPAISTHQGVTGTEVEANEEYQNLEARKIGKILLKFAKSDLGRKISDALDWRPDWEKKMTPEQRKEHFKCKPTWYRKRCWGGRH